MAYFDDSQQLTPGESTTLDGLATGAMPVKTHTGFAAATQDSLPSGTTNKAYNPAAVAVTGGTVGGQTVANTALAAADRAAGARGIVQTTGTLASDALVYDVTGLAGDTQGPIELYFFLALKGSSYVGNMDVRINGSKSTNITNGLVQGIYNSVAFAWAGAGNPDLLGGAHYAAGDWGIVRITIPFPQSSLGARLIRCEAWFHQAYGSYRLQQNISALEFAAAGGEITSLGIELPSGSILFDSSLTRSSLRRLAAP